MQMLNYSENVNTLQFKKCIESVKIVKHALNKFDYLILPDIIIIIPKHKLKNK